MTLIAVVVVVIAGVYAITWWQRSRETKRLLEDLMVADHGVATKAMDGLRDRAPGIRADLIRLLQTGNDHVRWRAAMLLGEAGGSATREALVAALDDEAGSVKLAAMLSLAKLGAADAADRIALLATDPDEEVAVRAGAVRALALLRASEHAAQVRELVADRPPVPPPPPPEGSEEEAEPAPPDDAAPIRRAAVYAAAVLGAAARVSADAAEGATTPALATAQVLIASTRADVEPNATVRQAACYALADLAGLTGDPAIATMAVQALAEAVGYAPGIGREVGGDEVANVRIAAVHSLRIIKAPVEAMETVEGALAEAEFDDHYWVREAATEATQGG